MIELSDVSIRSGDFSLTRLNLRVEKGVYAVLMGKTGAGKTTILEVICGLRSITAGKIFIDEHDVTDLPPGGRGIGYVPQDLALFPTMTVRRHLQFAPMIRQRGFRRRRWEAIKRHADELADRLGISHLMDRKPANLSGGEAQRVALGRALSFRPQVLLLDEPLSALDEPTRAELRRTLAMINRADGVTVLHVTHDELEATELGDARFRLVDGKI